MKKLSMVVLFSAMVFSSQAQEENKEESEEKKGGFKKENLFTGGSLTASFFNGTTSLGISPYFGYSINRFVDVAVSVNVNYTSQRDYYEYGDKIRQTVYGPGAFVRLYPVRFIFAQAQYEHNFIKYRYVPADNVNYLTSSQKVDANSFLIGGGYTSGREGKGSTFYYVSILWDISRLPESPYVDGLQRPFPIIRAGYNIALFQGERGMSRRRSRRDD